MSDLFSTRDHARAMAAPDSHRPDCRGTVRDRWGPKAVHPDPTCDGRCVPASDRALWLQIADEIDGYLAAPDEGEGLFA